MPPLTHGSARNWLGALVACFVLTLPLAFTLIGHVVFAQEKGRAKGGGIPPALVEVAEVQERKMASQLTLVGTTEAWLETVVAALEAGLVDRMLVDAGDPVKKGQLLCEQESTQLALEIAAAKASLDEAKVLQRQAEREWERQKRLYAINSVSMKAYEDAQFSWEAAKMKAARLEAVLHALEDQRVRRQIRAPVDGFVAERHTLAGQWLSKGDSVATVVSLDPIRVIVPVPERYVESIRIGGAAMVRFDALPGREFKGKVAAVVPRADDAARTFPVRIELPNPKTTMKAGMLARVTLDIGTPQRAFLVPKDALILSEEGTSVVVVNDQSARFVPVRMGQAEGDLIVVLGDLAAGMKVVTRGNERLRPGQAVRIVGQR